MSEAPVIIAVARIRLDGGTQPRCSLSSETVEEYAEALKTGAKFPPVVVFYDGESNWLADGFHRVEAHKKLGTDMMEAVVHQGDRRDAILHSVGANSEHGVRRTNADKRRAVERLLRDEEWSRWTDSEIARRCRVSHPFVGKLRRETGSPVTVSSEPARAPERQERTYVTKHGTEATMRTENIGKTPRAEAKKKAPTPQRQKPEVTPHKPEAPVPDPAAQALSDAAWHAAEAAKRIKASGRADLEPTARVLLATADRLRVEAGRAQEAAE